ncbi:MULTISPECIES: acyl-CoA thioesterase [unclassified Microbacterium]|uniref:acyl-CoA thioesterase n=1 Tax=unclassified Microbacterium TaxID=2609290 RepID=UPI003467D670
MPSYTHRVRVPEIDNQGYVFNSRYLEIADAALTEFLRAGRLTLDALRISGFDPSVVETTVRYRLPAKLDDLLRVETQCVRVGVSSFEMSFEISRDEKPVATIRTVYVNVDPSTDRSRPMPEVVTDYLRGANEAHTAGTSHIPTATVLH